MPTYEFNKVCIQISLLLPHISEHSDVFSWNYTSAMHKIFHGMLLHTLLCKCPENSGSMVLYKKYA